MQYFLDTYRPVYTGDTFTCKSDGYTAEFVVVVADSDSPWPCCIVANDTVIQCAGESYVLKLKPEPEPEPRRAAQLDSMDDDSLYD